MKDYKQWSGKTRIKMSTKYRGAVDKPKVSDCEMCGQHLTTMRHAEDYGPTKEDYFASMHSLCGRCHAMLHLRFRFPNRWNEYKEDIRRNGVQLFIPSMGSLFLRSSRWEDMDYFEYKEGKTWWELLSTDIYKGEIQ